MKRWAPLAVLGLVTALGIAYWCLRPDPIERAFTDHEEALRRLAEHLARSGAGRRALVVSNPFAQQRRGGVRKQEEAGVRGLRAGFGQTIAVGAVAYPALKPEAARNPEAIAPPAGATTPLSFMVAEESFDQLAARHPDCDLIVSLIGLPANVTSSRIWEPGPPKLALLLPDLRVIGGAAEVRAAIMSGKLAAFVCPRPQLPAPQGLAENSPSFDRNFLLVAPENLEGTLRQYPDLLETLTANRW